MVDKSLIGRFGPDFTVPIERGKVREFANAVHAPWPEYLDDPRAVVPPTFLVGAGVSWGYTLERPRGTLLEALDHDLTIALHAEEAYIFHGEPPRVGDVLTARAGLENVVEKHGRRGGDLTFLTLLTEFRNPGGNLVAEARAVTVTSTAHDSIAPNAPDYQPFDPGREPRDLLAGITAWNGGTLSIGDSPGMIDTGPLTTRELVRYAAAGGEDDPLHYDMAHAQASGFPGLFGLGMHQAGVLGAYATRWLGAHRVRGCNIRFHNMYFAGEPISYRGEINGLELVDGRRIADVDLQCVRTTDGALLVGSQMRFDVTE